MLPAEIIQKLQGEIGEKLFYPGQSQADMLKLLSLDYLAKTGYLESISSKMPVRNGLPIPWITYPALNFLECNTSVSTRILEFGGGTSTFFWALRGNPVTYLEFDGSWSATISTSLSELGSSIPKMPVSLLAELSLDYRIEFYKTFAQESSATKDDFSKGLNDYLVDQILGADLIMVDGLYRNYLLELSSKANPDSIVVLDNAERWEYSPGVKHMIDSGWKKVEFTGLGPVNPYGWTTAIFSKI